MALTTPTQDIPDGHLKDPTTSKRCSQTESQECGTASIIETTGVDGCEADGPPKQETTKTGEEMISTRLEVQYRKPQPQWMIHSWRP
jgi:hypothetical protein